MLYPIYYWGRSFADLVWAFSSVTKTIISFLMQFAPYKNNRWVENTLQTMAQSNQYH